MRGKPRIYGMLVDACGRGWRRWPDGVQAIAAIVQR